MDPSAKCGMVLREKIRELEKRLKPEPEDVTAQLRARLSKSILQAMVWTPACKTGSATFSVSAEASLVVVRMLLGLAADAEAYKRMTVEDLNEFVPGLQKRIRYDFLWICGPSTVMYDEGSGEVTVSGHYGLPGSCK